MSCKCDTINIVNDNNVIVVSHADGRDGKSAYQQAVEGGYTGTEQEFNCSLSLLADVAEGKKQIADAINYKGGEAEATQAFTTLAEDIKDIPNFDQYFRLAGVLAGSSYMKDSLAGHNENITAGNIEEINDLLGSFTRINSYAFFFWDKLKKVNMPNATFIGVSAFSGCSNLEEVSFQTFQSNTQVNILSSCSSLKFFYSPSLSISRYTMFTSCKNLQNVTFGVITDFVDVFYDLKPNLRNITIGAGTDVNLPFQCWTATNVIAEGQSGIDELNSNLYNNLLTKLYDHSNDGQTRTLRLGWLAHVTQENIDYANSKGWTLTK